MSKFSSAPRSLIAILALAAISVGCHRATTTPSADTAVTATTTAPATTAMSGTGAAADTRAASGTNTMTGTSGAGMTGSGSTDGAIPGPSGVKNNSGQTQGTAPNTSLPVSDGSR